MTARLCRCGHAADQHGQERAVYEADNSKREVCLECPGYEEPGYPRGRAWHRFKEGRLRALAPQHQKEASSER